MVPWGEEVYPMKDKLGVQPLFQQMWLDHQIAEKSLVYPG